MKNRQTSSSRSGSQYREEKSSQSGSCTDRARSTRSDEARAGSERSSNRSGRRNEPARGRGAHSGRQMHGEGRGREYARAARSYSEGGNCADLNSGDSSPRRSDGTREREAHVGAGNRSFSPRKGQGLNSSWMADRVASFPLPLATLAPVLCIAVVVLIAIFLVIGIGSCVSSADNSSQGDGAQADQMEISYTPSIQAIDGVSDPGTNV